MLNYHGLSETGPVREENQDGILLLGEHGVLNSKPEALPRSKWPGTASLFALADGMGGYAHGTAASQVALQAVYETCCTQNGASTPATLKRAFRAANLAVYSEAVRLGVPHMGTTLTAACLDGPRLHLAHIGDSRAYRIRSARQEGRIPAVECLTRDHSMVGELLRMGVITPAQVRSHPRRSILTRALGITLFAKPDFSTIELQTGDQVIICSDGLWSVIEDGEFARPESDLSALCRALVDMALERGSDDNLSVIIIQVNEIQQPVHKNGRWLQRVIQRRRK